MYVRAVYVYLQGGLYIVYIQIIERMLYGMICYVLCIIGTETCDELFDV